MKLKYIFTSLVAALGLMLTSCTEEADTFLKEVQVSSSYIAIPAEGGNVEITVNAQDAWAITVPEDVDWLTVAPLSGAAGESTVKFSAAAATDSRETTVKLVCLGKTQNINVIQMTEKTELPITPIATVISTASGTFRVKGVVTKVVNTQYGNFYMNDDSYTGSDFQIYGTKVDGAYPKDHPKGWDAFDIEPGDIITVEGPYSLYNTTHELVDVEIIAHEKSLIKVASTSLLGGEAPVATSEFPLEGGSIKVDLSIKGSGFHVIIPEEAKSWLHIEDFDSSSVTLKADKNDGGDRGVEVTFSTEKDGKTYTCVQAFTQKGAILEVSIAEFLAAEVGDTQYRLTGLIISEYAADKQGQSFTIRDWSGEVLVYRLNDYKASGAKVDDIITVVGKRGAYGETKQMVSGVYESHIPVTTVTIADFITKPDDKPADNHVGTYYKVTGTITSLKNNKGQDNDYGNLFISDGTTELYVYGLYPGWGASGDARKGFVKAAGIEEGDVLTSIGYKDTYSGTIELCGGIYVSHEKGQSGGIKIDGDLSDWSDITAYASSANSRIREWKFYADNDNVYFYIALRKNRADSSKKLVIGFNTDNDSTTGTLTDNNEMKGCEAIARNLVPFTDSNTAAFTGTATGEVVSTAGETASDVVVVWAVPGTEDASSDSSNAYLELSIPKAKLGLPTGTAISIGPSYDYYFAGYQSITL